MIRLRFKRLLRHAALPAILSLVGCNQTPATLGSDETAQPPVSEVSDPDENPVFQDISAEDAVKAVPMIQMGIGPVDSISPQTLEAMHFAMIKNGQINMARQLQASYDFRSGAYLGDPIAMKNALAKGAWWNGSYISHRGAIAGSWLPWVGVNAWSGTENGPRLNGWHVSSAIENGVTPSLRWRVNWNGHHSWTGERGWNQLGSDGNLYLAGIRGYSTYENWHVCYELTYKSDGMTSNGTSLGCNNTPAGGTKAPPSAMVQYWDTEIYRIKFNIYYSMTPPISSP